MSAGEVVQATRDGAVLTLTLSRPEVGNAMNTAMLQALLAGLDALGDARVVVLRGAGRHFCVGGDVADMAKAIAQTTGSVDAVAAMNRRFGALLERFDACPAAVIAVCHGAVMGGGLGLACVADVTVAVGGARFRMPEARLGLSPAQIAPFVVRRVGASVARRMAVTAATLSASEAVAVGLAHRVTGDPETVLETLISQILCCEPAALAESKRVIAACENPLDALLDDAATGFSRLARSDAARAGFGAFVAKTPPPWAPQDAT